MEFRPKNNTTRPARQRRLVVPQRGDTPSRPHFSTPQKPTRATLFDDDEKLINDDELEDIRFRDIIGAWIKQAISHSPLEKKLQEGKEKSKRLNEVKKDIKWALMADLDEPVKPTKKQPSRKHPPHPTTPNSPSSTAQQLAPGHGHTSNTIDININFGALPKLPTLKKPPTPHDILRYIKAFRWNRRRAVVAAALLVTLIGITAWNFVPGLGGANSKHVVKSSIDQQKPDYATLTPHGKTVDELGGWHRVSPPGSNAVFAYADKIDDVPVTVSQQPIPDSFQPDIDKNVAELAKSYVATDKITTGAVTIYVGTSASGPQSAIMTKNNVLILVKSTQKISDDSWAAYANSLN